MRKYDATIQDAVTELWEASDRVCGKRFVVMMLTLLPSAERVIAATYIRLQNQFMCAPLGMGDRMRGCLHYL